MTTSPAPSPLTPIPDGPMTVRAASKFLDTNAYGIMKLIAEGRLQAQKVYGGAGGHRLQVLGESVRAYLDQTAPVPATAPAQAEVCR